MLAQLRRNLCVIAVVGQIGGHDVVLRLSMLDIVDRAMTKEADSPEKLDSIEARWLYDFVDEHWRDFVAFVEDRQGNDSAESDANAIVAKLLHLVEG